MIEQKELKLIYEPNDRFLCLQVLHLTPEKSEIDYKWMPQAKRANNRVKK
jgi:hypothetical protein